MIKHIVLFKLKDNSEAECKKAAEVLLSMKGNVDLLRGIEVGCQVVLDDEKAIYDYQNDEYHCSVVKKHMHAVAESSVAIDYEI